ncbi:MAG: M56 family metallopeptidase [Acidobacteriota bacterium]
MIPDSLAPLANHLWQSTLFAGAAGLLTLALRKHSARVRNWVWVAASFKFLVPLALLVGMGSYVEWKAAPAIPPNVSAAVGQVSQPFVAGTLPSPRLAALPAAPSRLPAILFGIWACGFFGISISWWIRWRRIALSVRAGKPEQLGLPIRTVSSPSFLEPGVFGLFRPVLLLPEGILDHLTAQQWRSIIAHELCHVRNRDNLIGAIQMFVETVFWFHPLVWWVGKRIFEERERACDEEVLRLGSEPRIYAQGILKICELYLESPVRCVAGISGANLKKRIESIMNHHIGMKLTAGKKLLVGGVSVLAVLLPFAAGVIRAQEQANERFEVASIRRVEIPDVSAGVPVFPTTGGVGTSSPTRISYHGTWIFALVAEAFGVPGERISGIPASVKKARYDLIANIPEGATKEQYKRMLGNLLRDRFHLRFHLESKSVPVYVLRVGKNGPKLKETARVDAVGTAPAGPIGAPDADGFPTVPPNFKGSTGRPGPDGMFLTGQDVPLAEIMGWVQDSAGRPIIDETGLAGRYDVKLHFEWKSRRPVEPGRAPSVFTAVEEQLGLKLESASRPLDHLIIDSMDIEPTEN